MTLKQEIEALAAELQVYITGKRIDPLYRNEAERTILRTADRLTQIAAQMPAWQPIEDAARRLKALNFAHQEDSGLFYLRREDRDAIVKVLLGQAAADRRTE